jgi:ribosomal protein S18 acetylase RimI-like enzyme
MEIEIRPARPEDVEAVMGLMREFAEYENLLDSFEITAEKLADAAFGDLAIVEMLIATEAENPVGYALFIPYFASFRGQRGIYLEDIYISSAYRGCGIGERLLRAVAATAAERGGRRIDFQVLEWNESAIAFYEKLGADRSDDERHFKFTDTAFRELSSQK